MYSTRLADSVTVRILTGDSPPIVIRSQEVGGASRVASSACRKAEAEGPIQEVEAEVAFGPVQESSTLSAEEESPIDPSRLYDWVRQQIDANAGVMCPRCETLIGYEGGTSTPLGSMHKGCASAHESEHPEVW
jgi:hypothetical protein